MPPSVKIFPGEELKDKAAKEEHERQEKSEIDRKVADETEKLAIETKNLSDFTGWLAIFTAALVLGAFAQVGLFWWQLRLIRESLEDAKIAAEAAKEGAKAARDSADISKLSMVASNRAYVHFDGMRWNSHFSPSDNRFWWNIRPRWINSGNTPTRQLRVYVAYEFRDDQSDDDFAFTVPSDVTLVPGMVYPKGSVESANYTSWGSDLVEVQEGRKHLFVWGVAKYHDVFPGTAEHVTKFCVHARRITGDPLQAFDKDNNIVDIVFASYRRHNCADEDCYNQT